jgi:ribosomal protein S18 acetylase RimI-like enzyme
MSKFLLTLDANSLATQISSLINSGHQLKFYLTQESIKYSPVRYLIELHKDKVIGTIGLEQYGPRVTELKHLCVHPDYRRQGIGLKLLERGAEASLTEFVFGAVRSDNLVNIRNNLRIGMVPIGKKSKRGYSIIIFARRRDSDTFYKRGNQRR